MDMIFHQPVNITTIDIRKICSHPTLGFQLKNDDRGPIITHCVRGTPAAKVPQWHTVLQGAVLYSIDDHVVHKNSDISKIIDSAKGPSLQISIIPPAPTDIHPETVLPQLNFDQFLHISSLHQDIITNSTPAYHQHDVDDPNNIVIHKLSERDFTRRQLLK